MHMPSIAGRFLELADGEKRYLLAPADVDAELAFQDQMEREFRKRLPRPGEPDRREMLEIHQDKVNANEFAFNGPAFRRYLSTFGGQAHYLHFLMAAGYQRSGGKCALALPVGDIERRLRAEAEAARAAPSGPEPPCPLTELWLEVLARDFPYAVAASAPSPATTAATSAPTTPA